MPGPADALLRPLRMRILEELVEPGSAASVGRRLALARQKVGYHMRELEKQKLVELVEERRVGSCTERVVRSLARAYLASAEAFGAIAGGAAGVQDRFSSDYLVALAAQSAREVAALRQAADVAERKLTTLTLASEVRFASARDRAAFVEELAAAVARLVTKYHDENHIRERRIVST